MNLNSILIGSEQPERLWAYYSKLLGEPGWNEGPYRGWQIGNGGITIGPHDEVKGRNAQPGRLIWNIESGDVKGDFERFKAAGATIIREPYQPGEMTDADPAQEYWIATFCDPDDNYFQLVSPFNM